MSIFWYFLFIFLAPSIWSRSMWLLWMWWNIGGNTYKVYNIHMFYAHTRTTKTMSCACGILWHGRRQQVWGGGLLCWLILRHCQNSTETELEMRWRVATSLCNLGPFSEPGSRETTHTIKARNSHRHVQSSSGKRRGGRETFMSELGACAHADWKLFGTTCLGSVFWVLGSGVGAAVWFLVLAFGFDIIPQKRELNYPLLSRGFSSN